jgi:hypothetical protein
MGSPTRPDSGPTPSEVRLELVRLVLDLGGRKVDAASTGYSWRPIHPDRLPDGVTFPA